MVASRKKIVFMINPASGFGKTKKKLAEIKKEIRSHLPHASILLTRHQYHAMTLTKEALLSGAERIVVVGGDGTLNEVINGYFDKSVRPLNKDASIAVLPCGTGSDFVRSINVTKTFRTAFEKAIYGDAMLTDIGSVHAHDANGQPLQRLFINVASMGLSGLVAGFMKTVTRRFGSTAAYFLATVQAIRSLRPPTLSVTYGTKTQTIEQCSLLSVANAKFFGSGMMIAPDADLGDGLFDVVSIKNLSATFFLLNGYRVYQGSHLTLDSVDHFRHASCSVMAQDNEPVYIETDGELFGQLPAQFVNYQRAVPVVRAHELT